MPQPSPQPQRLSDRGEGQGLEDQRALTAQPPPSPPTRLLLANAAIYRGDGALQGLTPGLESRGPSLPGPHGRRVRKAGRLPGGAGRHRILARFQAAMWPGAIPWLPVHGVTPSRKPRAPQEGKPCAGRFLHITSSENPQSLTHSRCSAWLKHE